MKGLTGWTRYGDWGALATHLRFVDRSARKLARSSFHGMAIYQAKMERKQGFLFRCVDIVMELFAMSAAVSRARQLRDNGSAEAPQALELADLFCRQARRRVKQSFKTLWSNDDSKLNQVAARVMKGEDAWLEVGRMDLGLTADSFKTHFLTARGAEAPPPKVAAAS